MATVTETARAEALLARVRSVPPARVTTYGDLAPGAPRFAGAILASCSDASVPWQRVVRADGSLAKGERQRRLLEREGVPFRGARVEMQAAWVPVGPDAPGTPVPPAHPQSIAGTRRCLPG